MDSYRVSKAWHHGRSLADDIHELLKNVPDSEDYALAKQMRHASALAPRKIAESLERELVSEKLHCYKLAREALVLIQSHLNIAREFRYIDQKMFDALHTKAVTAHNELNVLIEGE